MPWAKFLHSLQCLGLMTVTSLCTSERHTWTPSPAGINGAIASSVLIILVLWLVNFCIQSILYCVACLISVPTACSNVRFSWSVCLFCMSSEVTPAMNLCGRCSSITTFICCIIYMLHVLFKSFHRLFHSVAATVPMPIFNYLGSKCDFRV